jgi:hypothetical protein
MGYELFNRMGLCVGHFTSNTGYDDILKDVAKRERRFPEFYAFLVTGYGDVTKELLQEIKDYIALDTECREIAEDLLVPLKKMKWAKIDI